MAVANLLNSAENELVKFAPVILNQLLRMICSKNIELGKESFLTLLRYVAQYDCGAPTIIFVVLS